MSDALRRSVSQRVVAVDPPAALTAYDEIAAKVSAGLADVISLVPAFEPRHAETERFVQRYQTFSNEVIRSTIAAIEANPELNVANKFNVQEGRATLQYLDAFRPVIDLVEELLTNLRFTSAARKSKSIADALQTYAIAKGIGRDPASAGVAKHAENIKRDLRRPGPKRKPATPSPAPEHP
ncbi:MAG: hypothetical protein QOC81_3352 [Thermoanaerobaculia bacterium]|nr:hypothetical protein [Thermoanaerobaculia bacterium]